MVVHLYSLECSLHCVLGRVNAECDACMCEDHTLLGSVRGAGGLTAQGAAILRSGKLLTLTDHNGHFRIPGFCPDGNTTLTISLQGHANLSVIVPHSSERTSALSIRMKRTGTVESVVPESFWLTPKMHTEGFVWMHRGNFFFYHSQRSFMW